MDFIVVLQSLPTGAPPFSAFILCFFPLAAVIIGFIVAAKVTDKAATASYRRIDPADEDEVYKRPLHQ